MPIPVYYTTPVPDGGFVGLGYGNPPPAGTGGVATWGTRMPLAVTVEQTVGVNPGIGFGGNPNLGSRVGSNGADQASEEGSEDSISGKKVKFLCSFGGKVLPRPSDGMLRYVGGQTRIISVRRDVTFSELVQKMADAYGQPVVIKYQLPDEDLDALVSVSCPDDLENMMDEYAKLVERSTDGSAKLRVFLFSVSELDSAGMVQLGDLHDSGQRYVDAINGIVEGVGSGITRKGSMASAASTQNSDFSGVEGVDSLGPPGQGDATGLPSTNMLSPRADSATSHDNTPRLACAEANPALCAEASAVPVVKSGANEPLPSQPVDVERSVPLALQQQQFDLQQPGVAIRPPAPYLQAYVGPHQEVRSRAEYVQLPPQLGFPHPHLLGTPGSVFPQLQFPDNSAGVAPHHFVPAVHMTMTPSSSSHVTLRPNMIQPLMQSQPQQTRLDTYPDVSTYAPRLVHVPVDQSYNSCQAQVPPAVVGGGFGWLPVTSPEHVVFPDGMVPHQHGTFPEKILRFEDCSLCQKALPHAHSDTLVQERKESVASPVSGSNSVYHSLRLEDNMRAWPANRVVVTGAMGEGIVEHPGVNTQPRVLGHMDHQAVAPKSEAVGVSENHEHLENEKIAIRKADDANHSRMPVPQCVMGLIADQSPYGVFVGNSPQSCQEDGPQQHLVPTQYQIRHNTLVNRPLYSEALSGGGGPFQTTECLVHESPEDYSGKFPGAVHKEEALDPCISLHNLRPIEGRMEGLRICPSDVFVNNKHNRSPVDKPRNDDVLDHKPEQIAGTEVHLDNAVSQPKLLVNTHQIKPTELTPCTNAEIPYPHHFRPVESYEVAPLPILGNPGPYSQPEIGNHRMASDEVSYGDLAFPTTQATYITDRIPQVTEWKDDTAWFQPKMFPCDVGALNSTGNIPSSLSPSHRIGDIQDSSNSLFSNQDPWNMRHDTHFPPPRPNKITTKKEAFETRDAFVGNCLESSRNTEVRFDDGIHLSSGNMNTEFNWEHDQPSKGSEEELIKQKLQAVAEGVAASVLQSSTSSINELSAHEMNDSLFEANQDRETQSSVVETQHRAKVEDINSNLPEKTNIGFPVSDGIGRLQIINNSDLEELRELGSGTFGTVYHGKWKGTDVAIKRINDRCFVGKPSEQERMRDDFWNEAINLADLHHPNVVAFYGVVLDGPGGSVATVTEYMVNGSLRTALQKNERNLDKRKRILIAMDVAFGMEYLHGKNIVHFDLKSDNLLVNLRDPHRPICKVGDLGLSKVKCRTLISGGVRGTLPWMAPELLNGSSSLVTDKVDVFSFGIVMWELLTGEEPYTDLHYGAIIGGIVSNTLRPLVPESCDPEWKSLMERCWSAEPSERPNFTEIANQLRAMSAKIPLKGQCTQPQNSSTQT